MSGKPFKSRLTITRWNVYGLLVAVVTVAASINLAFSGLGFVFWPDSIGYLGPLADWQAGRGFTAWYGRGFLYPAFLAVLIQDSSNYLRVLFAQMFLLEGVFVFAAWVAWRCERMLDQLPSRRAVSARCVLMIGLISFDFNSTQLGLMHTAMPETLFTAFLALQCFLVWMTLHPTATRRQFVGLAGVTFIGFVLILIKPHYLVTAFVLPAVLVLMLWWQLARRYLFLSVLLGCVVSAPLHMFDQHLKAKYDPVTAKIFGPKTLFCNNLDILGVAFQRGVDDTLAVRPQVDQILNEGPHGWETQGFDGDTCMYGELGRKISNHFKGAPDAEVKYYYLTYISAALVAPDMVLRRLMRQLKRVLAKPFIGRLRLSNDCRPLEGMTNRSILFEKMLPECRAHDSDRIDYFDVRPKLFNLIYVLFLGFSILWPGLRWMYGASKKAVTASCLNVGVASLLATLTYVLLVGTVHSFDVFRYVAIISPLIFVSFCCMTVWLFSASVDTLLKVNPEEPA